MAFVLYDRVQQTGTANTTVSFTLSGSVTGYQSFSVVGNGNTTYYAAFDPAGNWEVGLGTYSTTGPTLSRTTIYSSSNSGSAVTFSGSVNVFVTYPSEYALWSGGPLGTPSSATLTNATGLPIATGVSGLGTGVATALVVNTGTSGSVVVNGGALGTPSSGTLTNTTGLPISTGVSGLGTGVATALAVNTGTSGSFVVNGGALGTPSSGTLTNATGLPLTTGVTGTLPTANGGTNLNTFTSGGAVYATSTSALTTGTLPVASGGTGVTSSSGANSVVLRDSNGNITYTNDAPGYTNTVTAAGTTTLTASATHYQHFSGTSTQTLKLPDETTIPIAMGYIVDNDSTGNVTVQDSAGNTLATALPGGAGWIYSLSNSSATGNWAGYILPPGNSSTGALTWGSAGLNMASSYISGVTTLNGLTITSSTGTLTVANGSTLATAGAYSNTLTTTAATNVTLPAGTSSNYVISSATQLATNPVSGTPSSTTYLRGDGTWSTVTPASSTYTRTSFTATSGQTTFSVTYSIGYIEVFLNGVLLNGTDYTATSGTSVVLVTGAATGDIVETIAYSVTSLGTATSSVNLSGGAAGEVPYQTGSGSTSFTAVGTSGQALLSGGTSSPTWGTLGPVYGGTGVSNNSTNTITFSGNYSLTLTLSGTTSVTLPTSGTLSTVSLSAANTWTGTQTFNGSSSTLGAVMLDVAETVNVVGSAPSSTTNFYVQSGAVQYYTSNAANNWTLNIAFSSGTSLNTALSTGQSITIAMLATQGSTAYYNSAVTIDGTSVSPYWQGGSAPTKGNASGIDVYTYTVIKTGSATYTVLASQTQF